MIRRGDIWWADLGPVYGSRPAKRRPVLVIQSDHFTESQIATVLIASITSNTELADMPGNVYLTAGSTGLSRDSVVNVSQLYTIGKNELVDRVGSVLGDALLEVDRGLRRALQL